MGNFHASVTVRGDVDRALEAQDLDELAGLARLLSEVAAGPALAVMNHDDDVLLFGLYENGALAAEHGWTNSRAWQVPRTSRGRFVRRLRAAFGTEARPLRPAPMPGHLRGFRAAAFRVIAKLLGRFTAIGRHERLAAEMGMPAISVGAGYRYVDGDAAIAAPFARV